MKEVEAKNIEKLNEYKEEKESESKSSTRRKLWIMDDDDDNIEITFNNKDKLKLNPLFSPINMDGDKDKNNTNY